MERPGLGFFVGGADLRDDFIVLNVAGDDVNTLFGAYFSA